ncbi:MAG TPA: DNA polymerase subunit beta [Methanomicrobia archaeon]|nr:DNA polymerase subunit beta [Methanomicrobia archaeon]
MRARIRDFVITWQDWIFSVVSYDLGGEHLQCFLRYVPDAQGDRNSDHGRYRKLDFHEAYEFLRRHRPEYVTDVHAVPLEDVQKILRPEEQLPRIAAQNEQVSAIYALLAQHIPRGQIGITGSYLCGLNTAVSDLDFVIYGRRHFDTARAVVQAATADGRLTAIADTLWRRIYAKRRPELNYETFIAHELRKQHRGALGDTYFDMLYVRDADELRQLDPRNYERGEKLGYQTITARVTDSRFAFDSPAIYELEHPEIARILAFTHTYAGQAVAGELVEARGMLERTAAETRLVVGTTREARGEWICSRAALG